MNRVLIVDDKPENRYMLSALMRGHGYDVEEAADPRQLLRARVGPPDRHDEVVERALPGGLEQYLVVPGPLRLEHGRQDARERTEVVSQEGVAGLGPGGDLTERHLRCGKGLAEGV